MRVNGLSATEAGLRLAIANALCTALGTLAAGPISDRLGVRDLRWLVWLPAITSAAVAPFAWGFTLAPSPLVAMLFLAPASFLGGAYFGPLYGAIQGFAPLRMRALAPACTSMLNTVLGLGIAPPLVGWLTDVWTPTYGAAAIRYSLTAMILVHLWAAAHLMIAGRTLRGDFEARERRPG
jgi:MFS family permease